MTSKKTNKSSFIKREHDPEKENYGLISSIEYNFDEFGFIDWKSLIPKEYLFPNTEKLKHAKIDYDGDIDALDDSLKLVKLGGIKHLARLRGYDSVEFDVQIINDNVISKCSINWIPNCEHPYATFYQECASCNVKNSDDFTIKFAETIACNRAFVRCVRNFLNVNIVGEEEIASKIESFNKKETENKDSPLSVTPQSIFLRLCKDKSMDFDQILEFCKNNDEELANEIEDLNISNEANLLKNLPPKYAKKLLKKIKQNND